MLTTIRYILITAMRDRLFFGLFAGIVFTAFVAAVLGKTALLEPQQMTLALSAAAARIILMVGLIVFTCFHLRAAFQTREIDVLLSRPISRSQVVLSYWLGFAVVSTILVVSTAGVLAVAGIISHQGFAVWCLSLLLEAWLVVAISLFAGFTLRSAVGAVLSSLGFYFLSRMIGFFIATAQSSLLFGVADLNKIFRDVMMTVSMAVPRLDLFSKTEWLIYGLKESHDLYLFVAQAAIFIPLLVTASIIDFKRRQF